MKIALVHDFIMYWGGAERVLQGLHHMFPRAPIFTLFYNKRAAETFFPSADIRPSFLQKFPFPYKILLPLFPSAAESLNFDGYDVVISSGVFSKGIITRPQTRHIHYCHTVPRFLWENEQAYIKHNAPYGARAATSLLFHGLRLWDSQAISRVDNLIVNSKWTKSRVKSVYKTDASVVYPFIENSNVKIQTPKQILNSNSQILNSYFLIVSRLKSYKNLELPVYVLSKLGLPLYIVGEGKQRSALERLAGSNVKFLGFKKQEHLPWLYHFAKAVIIAGDEDFGLVPIEAMAQGTPVLALRKGGAIETIIEGKTGEFFDEPTKLSFWYGMQKLLENEKKYNKSAIIRHARKFSFDKFQKKVTKLVHHG